MSAFWRWQVLFQTSRIVRFISRIDLISRRFTVSRLGLRLGLSGSFGERLPIYLEHGIAQSRPFYRCAAANLQRGTG